MDEKYTNHLVLVSKLSNTGQKYLGKSAYVYSVHSPNHRHNSNAPHITQATRGNIPYLGNSQSEVWERNWPAQPTSPQPEHETNASKRRVDGLFNRGLGFGNQLWYDWTEFIFLVVNWGFKNFGVGVAVCFTAVPSKVTWCYGVEQCPGTGFSLHCVMHRVDTIGLPPEVPWCVIIKSSKSI